MESILGLVSLGGFHVTVPCYFCQPLYMFLCQELFGLFFHFPLNVDRYMSSFFLYQAQGK